MTRGSTRTLSHKEKFTKLINQLRDVRGRILAKATAIPPEYEDEIFLGVWSIKDVIAHLAGWDVTNIDAAKSILDGKLPGFYAYHDKDWSTYNAQLVDQYKRDDLQELIKLARETHNELIEFLLSIPASEIYKDRGIRIKGYKVILARLLQVEKEDEEQHFEEIRDFVDSRKA
jgi:hypothetical protein